MNMRTIVSCICLMAVAAGIGCSRITLDVKKGTATVRSFGVNRKFKAIELHQGTNSFRVEGFESDQVQALRVGIDAGMAAALKAIKP